METDEKIVYQVLGANKIIIDTATKAITDADKYNKRIYIMFLTMVISFTIIISIFIYCYFSTAYGENYQQNITQEINNDVGF